MEINKDYISEENTYTGQNKPKYIVVHETDNFSAGTGAKKHASAQAAGNLSVSAHYYVGSDGVYQAARHSDGTYSIGKQYGSHPIQDATNRNTINIEICVNKDGDYQKARENAIWLVKQLMGQTGIPSARVVRHFDVTGKYCPRNMMDDPGLWDGLKEQLGQGAGGYSFTQKQFILAVQQCTGSNSDGIAGKETIGNTITVSRESHKYHAVVTPLERRLKALGYYTGEIEAEGGRKPWFGLGMEKAVNAYQKDVLGYKNPDGEVTAKKKMWKSLLGIL
ncbi:MAG: N-acetylmuramoyl-L-alanine amidase [Lachnospiraceae bacterium]|jgi:N-acetylmuramoyl-L-alanine amidase CwlA|nr:N-acetylmuramoyl-L-alanine amidase [Lachnospiraceae bacterium]